jgi:5-methylcytosine-specific restriction protein A
VPLLPPSRCTYPGCPELTTQGRCGKHTRKPWANPSANTQALSGRQRADFRTQHLRIEPRCRVCGSDADLEVDHIIEVADGGALLSHENAQTLCGTHHRQKTALRRTHRASQRLPRRR